MADENLEQAPGAAQGGVGNGNAGNPPPVNTPSANPATPPAAGKPDATSAVADAAKKGEAGAPEGKPGEPTSAVADAAGNDENKNGENADDKGGTPNKDNTGNDGNPPAPESVDYAKDLKVPDGIKLDKAQFGKACAIFKEMNLPKESAQKLLDFSLEMQKGQAVAAAEEKKRVLDNCKNEIQKREHFNEEVPLVSAFVRQLQKNQQTAPIAEFLCDGVFGNLPEIWDLTVYCARQMATEGRLVAGGKGGDPKELPLPERMYPSMNQKSAN